MQSNSFINIFDQWICDDGQGNHILSFMHVIFKPFVTLQNSEQGYHSFAVEINLQPFTYEKIQT